MSAASRLVTSVCPVLETPFTDEGEVDFESFDRLIDHLLSAGIRSAMFPGFASEFYKLSDEERRLLTDRLLERTRDVDGFLLVVSVPDHATVIAVRQAKHAVERGAGMINVLPPHAFGPSSQAVQEHLRAVIDAVMPIPVIVQYAPAQTGTALDAGAIASLARTSPNLVQVKVESTPPGRLIGALAALTPPFSSVVGYAGVQLIDALRRGVAGVQPGCSFVEIYQRIWKLWADGRMEESAALHTRLLPYISYWMQDVELIVAAEKRISMLRGIIASDHCRVPSRVLDTEECASIDRFLAEFRELLD